jgi:hypothetical protein
MAGRGHGRRNQKPSRQVEKRRDTFSIGCMMEVSATFRSIVTARAPSDDYLEIYTQLMNTWNGLPNRYWEKVLATIRAALNGMIREFGLDTAPAEPVDTRGISYNQAAMKALLEEPEVEQHEVTRIDQPIPTASEVYFDAEDGVDGDGNQAEEEEATEPGAQGVTEGEMSEGEVSEGEQGSEGLEEEEEEGTPSE